MFWVKNADYLKIQIINLSWGGVSEGTEGAREQGCQVLGRELWEQA